MEIPSWKNNEEDEQIELPPGFRFHPTDEELITHYLSQKVLDNGFCARAIGEVDLNKCEPWDLPWRSKMGEKEWYFFCVRDRKYPTGLRTNRATESGYWKATGKDKEIFKLKTLVGMKKTLVFYKGRAPKGQKTNWVMHEFRLEGLFSVYYDIPKIPKNEWVICRVFKKSCGGIKMHHPLMESSTYISEKTHVTCFSNHMEDMNIQQDINNHLLTYSSSSNPSQMSPIDNSLPSTAQISFDMRNFEYPDSYLMQDESVLKNLLQNNGSQMRHSLKTEYEQDTGLSNGISCMVFEDQEEPSSSVEPVDLDCLWNY